MADQHLEQDIRALSNISSILQELDEDSVIRVLSWLNDKYGMKKDHVKATSKPYMKRDTGTYGSIQDLFNDASPKKDAQKVLVAAYWCQVVKGQTDFNAHEVHKQIKEVYPEGLSNITAAFKTLIYSDPRLAIETGKSGTTQQSRKRYQLTDRGIKVVTNMKS